MLADCLSECRCLGVTLPMLMGAVLLAFVRLLSKLCYGLRLPLSYPDGCSVGATLELPWMLWWATSGGHPGPKLPIVYWPAGRPLLHLREPSDDLDHTAVLALAKPPLVTTMKFDTISDQV